MKSFLGKLTLIKNARGCYILDTIKGCILAHSQPGGCYGDCYALKIAARYGRDFSRPVRRKLEDDGQFSLFGFVNEIHARALVRQISEADMPFIRIGEMGDPSHDWAHTLSVCEAIKDGGKPIVIITKHIRMLDDGHLERIAKLPICFNTSVSAMDSELDRDYRVAQFERLKPFCKSVLRIVSCEFSLDNPEGACMNRIQEQLLGHSPILETIFRPSLTNPLVTGGVIKVKMAKFIKAEQLASVRDDRVYFGHCSTCPDMCGIS